jgi:predicted ATPase/DNA-binding winged helix-turn-helix (wHTH) protein
MTSFGPFRLFAERRLLTRDGEPVQLGGRALDILIHLAARAGEIVCKQALMAAVWPGRSVEENNLTVHISTLRRILADPENGRSVIQTVPGRGYVLLSDESESAAPVGLPVPSPQPFAQQAMARPASSFVGRVQERAALIAQLSEYPLVTVTAIGGMGKTRLAQQVALELAPAYPDGVHMVELASVENPALAVEHVAALFPLGSADRPTAERLVALLRNRRLLLVLDNCEHLIEPVSELAAEILAHCPGVSILATSREALRVAGERVFRLRPLQVPGRTDGLGAAEAIRYDAVALFVERAVATVPGFVFDDAAATAIVGICTRLDGIALAIEMAVPRLRVLTLDQVALRLHESLRVLSLPDRTAVPRHRTLRAMMDWSYALLSAGEQALLRRLSVFAGAADFEAVLAVAKSDGNAEPELLDQLAGLVDKSLVVADTVARPARYRLLETVRHYARDRLAESGESGLRRRHAEHYADRFEAAAVAWPTTASPDWLASVAADTDELRAALTWCFAAGNAPDLGLCLVGASLPLWWELPNLPLREGRGWFDRAIAYIGPDTPPLVAARVWLGHSWRDVRFGDTENFPSAERAVVLFRAAGDPTGLGAALWRAGSAILTSETQAEAQAYLVEAERMLRRVPAGKWLTLCLVKLGDLRMRHGEDGPALAAYEEALALARRTRHWYGLMNGGSNMAELLFHLGRRTEALAQLRSLRAELPIALRAPLTATLAAHLIIANLPGDAADAMAEVVDIAPAVGFSAALAWAIEALALLRARDGDGAAAARLAGYAGTILPSPATRAGARRAVFKELDAALVRLLPSGALSDLRLQGAAWTEAAAVSASWSALAACEADS